MATAMLSLLVCRALVILVAVPGQPSPFRDSCRATARHLVVHSATAILAATAVAKVVQQAQYQSQWDVNENKLEDLLDNHPEVRKRG